jgi:hypothetical protein
MAAEGLDGARRPGPKDANASAKAGRPARVPAQPRGQQGVARTTAGGLPRSRERRSADGWRRSRPRPRARRPAYGVPTVRSTPVLRAPRQALTRTYTAKLRTLAVNRRNRPRRNRAPPAPGPGLATSLLPELLRTPPRRPGRDGGGDLSGGRRGVRHAAGRPGQAALGCRLGHGLPGHAPIRIRPTPGPICRPRQPHQQGPGPAKPIKPHPPANAPEPDALTRHAGPCQRASGSAKRRRARPSQDSGSLGRTHYHDRKSRILPTTRTAPHRHTRPTARYRAVSAGRAEPGVAIPDPHPHAHAKLMRIRPGADLVADPELAANPRPWPRGAAPGPRRCARCPPPHRPPLLTRTSTPRPAR